MSGRDHTVPTNTRLSAQLHSAVEAEAERRGLSLSETRRVLLAEALGRPELAELSGASAIASDLSRQRWG